MAVLRCFGRGGGVALPLNETAPTMAEESKTQASPVEAGEDDSLAIPDIDLGTEEERRAEAVGKRVGVSLADATPVEGGFEIAIDEDHKDFVPIKQAQSIMMGTILQGLRDDQETICEGYAAYRDRKDARDAWTNKHFTAEEKATRQALVAAEEAARRAEIDWEAANQATYNALLQAEEQPRLFAQARANARVAADDLSRAHRLQDGLDPSRHKTALRLLDATQKDAAVAVQDRAAAEVALKAAEDALGDAVVAEAAARKTWREADAAAKGKRANHEQEVIAAHAKEAVAAAAAAAKAASSAVSAADLRLRAARRRVAVAEKDVASAQRHLDDVTEAKVAARVAAARAAATKAGATKDRLKSPRFLRAKVVAARKKEGEAKAAWDAAKAEAEALKEVVNALDARALEAVPRRHGFAFIRCTNLAEDLKGKLGYTFMDASNAEAIPDDRARRLVALCKDVKDVPVVVNLAIHPDHHVQDEEGLFLHPAGVGLLLLHTGSWCAAAGCDQPAHDDTRFKAMAMTATYHYCSKACQKADAKVRGKFTKVARSVAEEWAEAQKAAAAFSGATGDDAEETRACTACGKVKTRYEFSNREWAGRVLPGAGCGEGSGGEDVVEKEVGRRCRACLAAARTTTCYGCREVKAVGGMQRKTLKRGRKKKAVLLCSVCAAKA